MKKSIIVLFLLVLAVCGTIGALLSCISSTPTVNQQVTTAVPETTPEADFKITTANGAVTIDKYTGTAAAVVIPARIQGLPVTSIGRSAFSYRTGLASVTIPASVTSIGKIGENAFYGCTGFTAFSVDPRNTSYSSRDGVLFNKAGEELVIYPAGKKGQYAIPVGVTRIGDSAFSGCFGLTSVRIPASVTSIGDGAFTYCTYLTSINIPASVTNIGRLAFFNCTALTSVSIPEGVTSIGESAFSDCTGLTSVRIPASVTSIGDWAFYYCAGLTSVRIPASVTSIGRQSFDGCASLTSVSIGANVSILFDDAFPNKLAAYYDANGRKAGVYTFRNGAWSYSER